MRLFRATALALGLGIALAACSYGAGAAGPASPAGSAAPAASTAPGTASGGGRYGSGGSAATSEAPATAAPATADVQLASTTLGDVLADGAGRTLYVFTADSGGASACYEGCATNWPPLTSDAAPMLGTGLDAEDFGSITRTDGSLQVTFYGMPLYTFAGDTAAGQTNGQGIGGKWFVVGKDGKPVE